MNARPISSTRSGGRWFAWSMWVLTAGLGSLTVFFVFRNHFISYPGPFCCSGFPSILTQVMAIACSTVGVLIISHRPGNSIGWIFIFSGFGLSLNSFALDYSVYTGIAHPGALPWGQVIAWLAAWVWVPTWWLMLTFLLLLFPNGKLPSPRWRPVAYFVGIVLAGSTVIEMFSPGPLYASVPLFSNPFGIGGVFGSVVHNAGGGVFWVLPICAFASAISLIARFIGASGIERQQIKWLAYAGGVAALAAILYSTILYNQPFAWKPWVQMVFIVPFVGIPISAGIAILKYHLYDIDIIINRTLVYLMLTAIIIGIYALIVGYFGALIHTANRSVISLLAAGCIAVLFAPLRDRLQRGVNHLMYGERDEPYAVLSRLGERLETSLAPNAILGTIVETIGRALKLPFVEICLSDDMVQSVSFGEPQARTIAFSLAYQNEPVGQLRVAPRLGESLSGADHNLLKDLARQTGTAIHAARLTADLQRSRERLVLAREEERRRLRRDLHDDLAPTLASLGLTASTVADLIPTYPAKATQLAQELQAELRATVANIRRLVYDLRPPTLDELGLIAAVRERAAQYSNAPSGFHVTVEAPAEFPALPAAVEVAAYRIVQEALENVSKHSQARQCVIRLANHNGLEIEITDDGIGLSRNLQPGVGLRSMRERAEELGGSCVIEPRVDRGTRILAHLPIGVPDGAFARPDRG